LGLLPADEVLQQPLFCGNHALRVNQAVLPFYEFAFSVEAWYILWITVQFHIFSAINARRKSPACKEETT